MSLNDSTRHLFDFLEAGVSPFHTVSHAAAQLDAAGFIPLDFKDAWALVPGNS